MLPIWPQKLMSPGLCVIMRVHDFAGALELIFTVQILSKIKFEEGGRVDVGLEDSSLAACKQVADQYSFHFVTSSLCRDSPLSD